MHIHETYHIPIYGVLYHDDGNAAKAYLQHEGNPYAAIGDDADGQVAVELGIYGTPETFVISPEGKILYKHVGTISQQTWEHEIYPIISGYH